MSLMTGAQRYLYTSTDVSRTNTDTLLPRSSEPRDEFTPCSATKRRSEVWLRIAKRVNELEFKALSQPQQKVA